MAHHGFRGFGRLGDLGGAIHEIGQPLFLFLDPVREVGFGFGGCEFALLGCGLLGGQILIQGLLAPGQFAGLGAHLAEVIGELAGVLFANLIPDLLELTFGAGAGGEGLGERSLSGGFAGALHVVAGLLELAALFGHAGLVLGAVHALLGFVHVGEHLLLFLLEALEAAAQFLTFLFGVGLAEGGLQLLESLVDVLLPAGEFLQAVEDLHLFAAGGVGWGLGLAFGFVTALGIGELKLVQLAISHFLGGTRA